MEKFTQTQKYFWNDSETTPVHWSKKALFATLNNNLNKYLTVLKKINFYITSLFYYYNIL